MVLQRTELEKRLHFWRNETPDFLNPTLWPPNSPNLNPVDYKIWGCMQEMVYKIKVRDVEDLHNWIMRAWNDLDQRIIDSAVREWRKRLRACVEAEGGQFEYKLYFFTLPAI